MGPNEMTKKVKRLKVLQMTIAEKAAEAEAIKSEIKAGMGDREEIRAGVYKVTYKAVNAVRFDGAAFKKEMPELYDRFTKQTETKRLTIA